ncbi:MAG: glycerol dehydrogenase [Coriobacteriia bacterium]
MPPVASYLPCAVFAPEDDSDLGIPRVLISPPRYIQGSGVLDHIGRYLSIVPSRRPALLASAGGQERDGARLLASLRTAECDPVAATFTGECSDEEIARLVDVLGGAQPAVDSVIAFGGGKCIDTGKCVAALLGVPVVVCPSLASNDAPTSAIAVVYTSSGVSKEVRYFPHSPALVVVDTRVVAEAPARYLVAGIGDAMATWYEARTCAKNPDARSELGARPTLAAIALAELCATTLFADGPAAVEAVSRREVTTALERVVEANTLLSGIGFESGGLAAAHGIAHGCTTLPEVHRHFLHGEMVAIGVLIQLVLESDEIEARRVAEFFARVGLPIHLGQLGISAEDPVAADRVMQQAALLGFVGNEPLEVTPAVLLAATERADALGREIAEKVGDSAYWELRKSQGRVGPERSPVGE